MYHFNAEFIILKTQILVSNTQFIISTHQVAQHCALVQDIHVVVPQL